MTGRRRLAGMVVMALVAGALAVQPTDASSPVAGTAVGGTAATVILEPRAAEGADAAAGGPRVQASGSRARFIVADGRYFAVITGVGQRDSGALASYPPTHYWLDPNGRSHRMLGPATIGAAATRASTNGPDPNVLQELEQMIGVRDYLVQDAERSAGPRASDAADGSPTRFRGEECQLEVFHREAGEWGNCAAVWTSPSRPGSEATRAEQVTRAGLEALVRQVLQWRKVGDLWIPAVREWVFYGRAARGEAWAWVRTMWFIAAGVDECDPAGPVLEPLLPDSTFVYDEPAPEDAGKPLRGRVVGEDLSEAWSYLRLNWHPWRDQPVFLSEEVRAYAEQE